MTKCVQQILKIAKQLTYYMYSSMHTRVSVLTNHTLITPLVVAIFIWIALPIITHNYIALSSFNFISKQ